MDRTKIEQILKENGYEDFKWISGKDVVVSQWPRVKWIYGCSSYGQKGSCPPSVPTVAECGEFFREYEHIAVIHLQKKVNKSEDRKEYSRKTNAKLLKLERAEFLAGHQKAFLLFMDQCRMCEECPGTRIECKNLQLEFGRIDIWVNNAGYSNAAGLMLDMNPQDALDMFLSNDLGVLQCTQAIMHYMVRAGRDCWSTSTALEVSCAPHRQLASTEQPKHGSLHLRAVSPPNSKVVEYKSSVSAQV